VQDLKKQKTQLTAKLLVAKTIEEKQVELIQVVTELKNPIGQ
jgi:hypothetical protein